ncbi:hypothetical protein B0H13DRAFT_2379364 [Mycena leptocephala]|nr:hypothetical protein B0H13DRAFT_2379364 [Mycena leptocephala]
MHSSSNSSSGYGQQQGDSTLARSPSRLGADGPLAPRLSGWFLTFSGPGEHERLASNSATKGGAATSPRQQLYPADFEPRLSISALIISDAAPELEAARRLQGNCSRYRQGAQFLLMCQQCEVEATAAYNRTKVAMLMKKSSSVFSGPQDHKAALFLADGMQHLEYTYRTNSM